MATSPTGPNQTIDTLNASGFVWGVENTTIPANSTLTLTINGTYYQPDYSTGIFPLVVNTPIYAQVN